MHFFVALKRTSTMFETFADKLADLLQTGSEQTQAAAMQHTAFPWASNLT